MFKCECGREFEKASSLKSHKRFCPLYVKKPKPQSKYKISDNLYRCECGREFNNYQSLNAHLSYCDYHHECVGTVRKLKPSELYHTTNWENKSQEEIKEIHKKSAQTHSERIKNGEIIPPFAGKQHSAESKEKMRNSTIKYIIECNGKCSPRYNKKQIEYINELNEKNHWNLQHAENGGEYLIGGYFLDGYDIGLNIAFEYDEPAHYKDKEKNILNDRDIKRQNFIITRLGCEFWRYNEYLDLLYKVN